MRKETENLIKENERKLPGELQKKLKTERETMKNLDNNIITGKVNCFKCKYMSVVNGVKRCRYTKKTIKVTHRSCRYYHRKHTTPKTKTIAVEKWNKYLNNAYYKENKEKLSKSQLKKVETWRITHKTYN